MLAPAVALKVAVEEPEATVTEGGTVSKVLLELSVTVEPLLPLRVTVQTLELPGPSEVGEHTRLLTVNGVTTEIEPPVAVTVTPAPAREAPIALATPTAVVPAEDDRVTLTDATTPLLMALLFIPVATQT
jgi:hypothetical protein